MNGSSPLTRGKQSSRKPPFSLIRLIPAHAGKTRSRSSSQTTRSAHPRSRGENGTPVTTSTGQGGSSPLTRGKHRSCRSSTWFYRLIPAHAGKTYPFSGCTHACAAHPRSRGENVSGEKSSRKPPGSSPLTRGKRNDDVRVGHEARLIPAHAGKTIPAPLRSGSPWAHPRSRGENPWPTSRPLMCSGSSPLTRGKPPLRPLAHGRVRLIPAHAGKTRRLMPAR